jgi:type IV secretion system protein VirD4
MARNGPQWPAMALRVHRKDRNSPREPVMALRLKFASLICGLAFGLTAATHFIGWAYRDALALGPRWAISEGLAVYPPWAFIGWHQRFGAEHRRAFNLGLGIVLAGLLLGAMGASLIREETTQPNAKKRGRGWAGLRDARKKDLLSGKGCVIGELNGRLITTQDLRPTLVTGGTRSGRPHRSWQAGGSD